MPCFVSYCRDDSASVKALALGLEAAQLDVWFDVDLRGGEPWWTQILKNIRRCDVFIFALSDASIGSKPCVAELEYATSLNRPIVPVQVGPVSSLAATPFGQVEIKPFRPDDAFTSFAVLAAVVAAAAAAPPLPDPLPPEHTIPYKYLMAISSQIDSADEMPSHQQLDLVNQLRNALVVENDEEVRSDIDRILNKLMRKPWAAKVCIQQIEEIQRGRAKDKAAADASTGNPWQPVDDPKADGAKRDSHGAGNRVADEPEPVSVRSYFDDEARESLNTSPPESGPAGADGDQRSAAFLGSFGRPPGPASTTSSYSWNNTNNGQFFSPSHTPPATPPSYFDTETVGPQPSAPPPPGRQATSQMPFGAPQQAPNMVGPGSGARTGSLPSPNWALSIIALISVVPGIVALIYSSQVSDRLRVGDIVGAQKASSTAKIWAIIGIAIGALAIIAGLSQG